MYRRLSLYVLRDFIGIFGISLFLITFVMCLGAIYKAIDILSKGIDFITVATFLINSIPYTLSYSIPISILFSTILLFGRLSADSELNAMKSSGLSLWQISSPLVLASVILSILCLLNNSVIYPKTHYENRALLKNIGVEDPIKLLDEGRFIRDFPGYMIYVGKKEGSNIEDLVFYEITESENKIKRTIRAKTGSIFNNNEGLYLDVILNSVRIEMPDPAFPDDATKTHYIAADQFPIKLDISNMSIRKEITKKRRNMTIDELINQIDYLNSTEIFDTTQVDREIARYRVHLHQRFHLALAPITFLLIGIPLGIRSHRRDSALGMILSLLVMFLYYLLMIIADGLDQYINLYPWLIPWIGTILAQLGGLFMIHRMN